MPLLGIKCLREDLTVVLLIYDYIILFERCMILIIYMITACVVPTGLVCDFTSDDVILRSTRDMDICNNHRAALFFYDVDLGFLIHHCSGRPVAPRSFADSAPVVIFQTTVPKVPNIDKYWYNIRRDFSKSL